MTIVDMNDTLSTVQTAGGQPKKDLPPSMVERMTLILDAFDGRAARLLAEVRAVAERGYESASAFMRRSSRKVRAWRCWVSSTL